MSPRFFPRLLPICLLLLASPPLWAQANRSQKIERIQVEDSAARIEETRHGGETERITVQPKRSAMPAYEVESAQGSRQRHLERDDGSNAAPARVWNLLKF